MLDVAPVMLALVYVSAGPDFKFYQPFPPGLYDTPLPAEKPTPATDKHSTSVDPFQEFARKREAKGKEVELDAHVGLPMLSDADVAHTRAGVTPDPGTMFAFEDFMDYMQIWSRAVPFSDYDPGDEEPIPSAAVGCVSPVWFPPVDRARDMDANNSWFFTIDYVHFFSILFMYWRGSISSKIVVAPATVRGVDDSTVYVSLGHLAYTRQMSYCPFPYSSLDLPPLSNFGAGTVCTAPAFQPVLEVTVPYRGSNTWANCNVNFYNRGVVTVFDDPPPSPVFTNVVLQNTSNDVLADAMFRKADSDFSLGVCSTLPPPPFWIYRGAAWP
jgi:hypothetical protein